MRYSFFFQTPTHYVTHEFLNILRFMILVNAFLNVKPPNQNFMSQSDIERDLIESVIHVNTETHGDVCLKLTEYLQSHESKNTEFVKRLMENAVFINHKNSDLIIQLSKHFSIDISQEMKNELREVVTPEYHILNDDVKALHNSLNTTEERGSIPIDTLFPNLFPSTSVNLLQFSAFCGSIKCFEYLRSNCKDIKGNNIEFYAAAGGNSEIIKLLKEDGVLFNDCIEVCVAYHRNDFLKTLTKEMETTKIPASIIVQSLNEEAFSIIYESLSDIDKKHTFLEEILDEPSSKCLPQFRKSIEEKLKSTSDEFRTYITDTYVASYKSKDVKKVNFDDLEKQEMKSSHFKLAVFFRVKGIKDDKLQYLLEEQSDPKAEDERQKALKRALDLIAVGDIKHISPLNGKNKTRISSLNDIIRILPEWENGTTVFSMKDQFGDISGDSFKQRVQKSGLCYMHAVVVYLYYAVRRNNNTWDQVIDMSEMIKKNFSGDKISDYIFNDGGGSTSDLLKKFAMSIKKRNPSIKPRVKIISPEDVTEELFIDHGPFVLLRFKVYDDFSKGSKLSYTDDSLVEEDPIGHHAMLVIGIRKNSDGEFIFLVQNWWEGKQIVEMSSEYLANHSADFAYIDGFNLTDYTNIDITSTTVTPFVETTVDKPETLLLERF